MSVLKNISLKKIPFKKIIKHAPAGGRFLKDALAARLLGKADQWRCAILHVPLEEAARDGWANFSLTLLPDDGNYRFLADPFGLWEDGKLYVFAEAYDYRTQRGVIDVLIYNSTYRLLERKRVLSEEWHLSYPYVFRDGDEIYMLPEAYKSGKLTLYKATRFPFDWEAVPAFSFSHAAIDATPFYYADKWWLFWTPCRPRSARKNELRVSKADTLLGPWEDLGLLTRDIHGARPGGTPWVEGQDVILPVQDCSKSYGGGLRLLRLSGFEFGHPVVVRQESRAPVPASLQPVYPAGMHTLAGAGKVTLVDVKRVQRGVRPWLFKAHNFYRRLKRAFETYPARR